MGFFRFQDKPVWKTRINLQLKSASAAVLKKTGFQSLQWKRPSQDSGWNRERLARASRPFSLGVETSQESPSPLPPCRLAARGETRTEQAVALPHAAILMSLVVGWKWRSRGLPDPNVSTHNPLIMPLHNTSHPSEPPQQI